MPLFEEDTPTLDLGRINVVLALDAVTLESPNCLGDDWTAGDDEKAPSSGGGKDLGRDTQGDEGG